ncbi:MAG: bifunctional DNA-binding transcriptional regulator/O6-methylguanine-DNA methyltransferase Ada [Acidimicrobiales bacterium]|jgi:AraC family transcriptional regulator of adaptative response/methylated-DNA-[protein]-cysteine methyltransferase
METLEQTRWRAVEDRDSGAIGLFVYAVRSTGVYCRPGCGARRALRTNVEFFATPLEAAGAGYRACKRCHPDQARDSEPSRRAVIETCRYVESCDGEPDVAALAGELGYSERHLRRLFSDVVGVSIGEYARAARAERARAALRAGLTVTDAIFEAGYGSNRAFYEHGAPRLGMAPDRYRRGAPGTAITFTSMITPVGVVVAARTARGVCSVKVGSSEAALCRELSEEFPLATIERDDDGLAEIANVLAEAVRGEGDPTTLPLDVAGTAFQVRVWEALRAIPSGETRTYTQVAASIGSPRAVRAVASACASNPAALTVPCHRVVRQDGSLAGYRWGLETKRELLRAEAQTHAP